MGKLRRVELDALVRAGKPTAKSDGLGLTFTVSRMGHAVWVQRYAFGGRAREITIGRYSDFDPETARRHATSLRVRIALGEDVALTKRRERITQGGLVTVQQVIQDYLASQGPRLKASTLRNMQWMIKKDIEPRIGNMRALDVNAATIVDLVEKVAGRSKSVARRVFESLSVLFTHALGKGVVPVHPFGRLRASSIIGSPKVRQRRALDDKKLKAFFVVLPAVGEVNALAVKILLATCVRKNELLEARKDEIDLDLGQWTIPGDREGNKSGQDFVVPLAKIVVDWFRRLFELSANSEYVLPGRAVRFGKRRLSMSRSTLNAAMKQALPEELRGFNPHDLRATGRTYLSRFGVAPEIKELCLNHALLGPLKRKYDKFAFLEERLQALEQLATHFQALETGEPTNVVSMKKAA